MSARKPVAAIHVWRDDAAANQFGCSEYYSVSAVDADDDEVFCDRGSKSLAKAWEMGCEMADDLGVECVEFAGPTGRATDRYEPRGAVR